MIKALGKLKNDLESGFVQHWLKKTVLITDPKYLQLKYNFINALVLRLANIDFSSNHKLLFHNQELGHSNLIHGSTKIRDGGRK